MATIEKLIKAFEALKVFQPAASGIEEITTSTKKKDQPPSKKDKMVNCNIVADCICAVNMRSVPDFPKFLGIAVEAFLTLCDDVESDIRMVADECLNRTIKTLLETNLGRLQVELYKEIKKNGTSRTLRAALWRFAEMCHLIRPLKCRPYIVNLLPCLTRICQRDEEAVQDTLGIAMSKICPSLMGFANDTEVKSLLKAFMPNLRSGTAVCRRTTATSLVLICQYSRNPMSFFSYLITVLLDQVLPVDVNHEVYTLLGVILCLRHAIPVMSSTDDKDQGMKGSFGLVQKDKEEGVSAIQVEKIFQLLLYYSGHTDHNVVTASLEALQQLLRHPPDNIQSLLLKPGSIVRTHIYQQDFIDERERMRVESTAELSVMADDQGLEEDADISIATDQPIKSNTSALDDDIDQSEDLPLESMNSDLVDTETDVCQAVDSSVKFTSDTNYSSLDIGDLNEEKSEKVTLSHSPSQDTLVSVKSISPKHQTRSLLEVAQDMNGNPEYIDTSGAVSPLPQNEEMPTIEITKATPTKELHDFGDITDNEMPLIYCVRLLCRRFLLSGTKQGLILDKCVRVSSKSLALGCIASAVFMCPKIFLLKLLPGELGDQDIREVVLYASHPDPILKGQTSVVISSFIKGVLIEGRGDFNKWLKLNSPADIGEVCLDNLVETLIHVIEDESSVATRQALIALQMCLSSLIESCHGGLGLQVLLELLEIRNNPYWLVKVELLDIVSSINFKVVAYLENICEEIETGKHHYLGKLEIQEYYIHNVVLHLLADEDTRVRHAAATALVKLIPNLFFSVDNAQHDPVTACAQDMTDCAFSCLSHQLVEDLPPIVQGLVKPYHFSPITIVKQTVESSLSRLIQALLHQIHISQSKYLTNGCCHALCLLCEEYMVSCYSSCWGCGPATHISTKDSTTRSNMKRPPSRSLSSSSTFSLEELSSSTGGGPLPMVISVLMSSSVALDLSAHQDVLQLTGNLMAGSAFKCLRSSEELASLNGTGDAGKWAAIGDVQLGSLIDQLLTHVARLMSCYSHVFEEQSPGPPQVKPSLPSLPNAPSLSPVKRKVKGDKEAASPAGNAAQADSKTPQKTPQKDQKEGEKEKGKKEGLGTFYNLPQYMKLFDVIKGAYSNYKTSLDLNNSDKFCNLLRVTLRVLSQILEITTLFDIGKYAEEFLGYFKCTFSLEPTYTVLCVQQLLKALFGTNIANQWEPALISTYNQRSRTSRSTGTGFKPGLYQSCLNQPYSTLTKSLDTTTDKTQSEQDATQNPLIWLKKRVERKVPAILKPGSKVDKSAIASYIRLFEPLVIKALKQYTVTSSLDLQHQVLNLLAQLVQLRVNYCLLDSDQIFIGFVLKQFEYIEEGQIRDSEMLIPHIFRFLVMLSYEKFPGKVIIDMPGVIHRCDGIMASGLQPTKHAIPALRPIVYDLFLLRGNIKSEVGKEQDTQREVVVSMLLRLINYYQALEMFVIVLQQCHRESEEKWKRLSRQVMDLVLPALSKQQINMDCGKSLDVLHQLFECVAPSVFRPVDILLKTLLAPPGDISCVEGLQRWLCLVLAILRVLMAQSKEEVMLSRLLELNLPLCLTRELIKPKAEPVSLTDINPEETCAWFLLQAVGVCSEILNRETAIVTNSQSVCDFLVTQTSHLLLYITYMFQSGLYRRVATAAMRLINRDRPNCLYSVKEINGFLLGLGTRWPTLALHWSNILILLNYDNQKLWNQILQTPQKYHLVIPGLQTGNIMEPSRKLLQCCNLEILRRGGLILYCDYVVENLSNAEHITWLTVNHVSDLIELTPESPVQDFISAIHRNPAASSMFVQAINTRCDHVTRPSLIRKTLKSLEAIHLSQSGSLLQLLIDKFLNTHQLSVARMCDTIACRRVEMLLVETVEESKHQLPLEDLDKLLQFMKTHNLVKRHARLASLLAKFRTIFTPETELNLSPERTHPLVLTPGEVSDINVNKDFYLSIVKDQCFGVDPNVRECAFLLQRLDYADILSITMTKEFCLSILEECIALGAYRSIVRYNRDKESLPTNTKPEATIDQLFSAAQLTMFRHINNIINHLPVPHQLLSYSRIQSTKNLRYYERVDDLFQDCAWFDMNFHLASSLSQYLMCIRRFPWVAVIPTESIPDICRFCVLCMEMLNWQLHHNQLPTSEQIQMCLECVALVLQNKDFTAIIGQSEYSTYVSAITSSVYQLISSLVVLPGEKVYVLPHKDRHEESEDDESIHLITSCDQISELLQCLKTRLRPKSTETQKLPPFLASPIRNIVTGLARLPLVNSYARVPPLVWKLGWSPSPTGNLKTQLPPLPVDFLQEKDVLEEFVFRINTLGWVSRHQFEETWMSLLGVLNPVSLTDTNQLSPEEEIERSQGMVIAVKAITSLLLQSTLIPQAGNPGNSVYEIRPRDKPLAFLHTRCGKKLVIIRGLIEQEICNLCSNKSDRQTHHSNSRSTRRLDSYSSELFEDNLERKVGSENFSLGQISLEGIWSVVGCLETTHSESDTTDSTESPQHDKKKPQIPLIALENKDRSVSVNGLDINSCLQFLSELYGPWLSPETGSKPPLMLLNAVVKSMLSLSDLFMEREQFEMMLDTFLDLYKVHPAEDEILLQYLIVGICKAAAVIGVDSATAERLIKIVDAGLRTTHLPSKISSLHGILYILETSTSELTKSLLPLITDFLIKHLSAVTSAYITSDQFSLTMWSTAFYVMENYHEDIKDGDFPSKIMQLVVNTASCSEDSISTSVFITLMKGLERLLLADVLSKSEYETIIKLSLDRLCLPSPQRALAALGLMFTCMYSGKSLDGYSPRPRETQPSFSDEALDMICQDSESLILAMERVTVLFDRIKKGYPYEARVITRLLPAFLSDFFPPQDIMNKVIGEFLSSQQPYPQLIAKVVFQVFNNLHLQNQQKLVRDWVMLSLSNFTQRSPIAMAIWSLTAFFISASTNPWLKALFPHVIERMGKMEVVDKRLFCLSAIDFYRQLTEDSQKRAFISTFQAVVQSDTPYQTLLSSLSS
ncbi:huntingtin [Patella vulgata]|uniref:huntingtin n=1 Tax=Patella vulgata TaxID=6465 RepID=UPI0024A9A899|nr:huntingtin [Patella vulgata]